MEKHENHNKQALRSRYLNYRSSLSKMSRKEKSSYILQCIKNQKIFKEAEVILVYLNYRAEVETTDLVEELLANKEKRVFAPKVEGMDISYYEIESMNDLCNGYQEILEPQANAEKQFNEALATNKCLVLVPGAVFDRQMGRMGYGKGFFDRFLGKYPECYRMALAFDCQIAKNVPVERHDVRMHTIITETEVINFNDK